MTVPVLFAAGLLAPGGGARGAESGTLPLHAEISWQGGDGTCPAGTPPTIDCHPHPGGPALVRGLGEVSQQYLYAVVIDPPAPECKARSGYNLADYAAHLTVKDKGEIFLTVKGIDDCLSGPESSDTVINNTQSYTVTGGSGAYAGASGIGTVKHVATRGANGHAIGRDVWDGTLLVPGLDFDLTAPTISGAVDKIVRATRKMRVTFVVTAQDNADGSLSVDCVPRSGARFKLGKTRVTCSAKDTSGNTAAATFTVIVKRRLPQRVEARHLERSSSTGPSFVQTTRYASLSAPPAPL